MVIEQLGELHDRLERGLDQMLGELRGMSEAQQRFRPAVEAWSATQVSHHLLLAQSGIVGAIEKMRGRKAERRTLADRLKHQAVRLVLFGGIRVRNPAPSATPDPDVAFEELEPLWAKERERTRGLLDSMDEAALGEAGFRHPIAGALTVLDSVVFLAGHVEHHLRQLRRIRSHVDFPI